MFARVLVPQLTSAVAWPPCSSVAARGVIPTTRTMRSAIKPAPSDFDHHDIQTARLNHGSFGACPAPVLRVQDEFRKSWLAQPDEWYFSGRLHDGIRAAAAAAATTLVPQNPDSAASASTAAAGSAIPTAVCLVENATVATVAVARRWAKDIKPGDVVVYLDLAYKACINVLREHCEQAGATLVEIKTPFLAATEDDICDAVEAQLQEMAQNSKLKPRYAFIDHVSSQPAILLPAKRLTALCREYGCEEVAVDGAHSVGSVQNLDVVDMGCDFFFSNLHKWGFAPSTATLFYARTDELLATTHHPITSWDWPNGLAEEALFPGTRDFSAILAVPAAVDYLHAWRSADGLTSAEYCHREVVAAASQLRFVWESEDEDPAALMDTDALVATQAMVMLPPDLKVVDNPGTPGGGIRTMLRDEFDVEAAIGNFGEGKGGYVRLSYAVYNCSKDVSRLRDAVMEILEDQRFG